MVIYSYMQFYHKGDFKDGVMSGQVAVRNCVCFVIIRLPVLIY